MSDKAETICVKCKWHCWGSQHNCVHACCCDKFTKTNYVTGNKMAEDCDWHNSKGDCSGFEEAPPEPSPKPNWLERLFGFGGS